MTDTPSEVTVTHDHPPPSTFISPTDLDEALIVYVASPTGQVQFFVGDGVPASLVASCLRLAADTVERHAHDAAYDAEHERRDDPPRD